MRERESIMCNKRKKWIERDGTKDRGRINKWVFSSTLEPNEDYK